MNRNGILLAIASIVVLVSVKALTISNRTVMFRMLTMVSIVTAVYFLCVYLVGRVIQSNNASRVIEAPPQPPVGRVTTRFVAYVITVVVALAVTLLQMFRPSGGTGFRLGVAWLIFLAAWFGYSAIREYLRAGTAKK